MIFFEYLDIVVGKQTVMAKAGIQKQADEFVPGYDREVGTRIKSIIERIGSLQKSGKVAGITAEQMAAWRDGRSKMSFYGATQLCRAVGVSLDWLVSGEGPERRDATEAALDMEVLEASFEIAEEMFQGKSFTPEHKAKILVIIYEKGLEEKAKD